MKPGVLIFSIAILAFSSCRPYQPLTATDDGKLQLQFVQVNDVYEIAPLSGGKEGGIARVATLKKQYLGQNPNTHLVIAGDFLSPSVFNSMQYNGKPIRGRQMVDALNAAGLDIAMFGNHEFDIKEAELKDRINESAFRWVSTNVFHKTVNGVKPFEHNSNGPVAKVSIINARDADGTEARIGIITATLPFNKADYVSYTDPLTSAREAYNQLKDSVDAVVAITHQLMEDDERMAREIPGLVAIMGGHEHDGRFSVVKRTPITKALANARDAYIVTLDINKKKKKTTVSTKLERLNELVPMDSSTRAVVNKWMKIAEENYTSLGFDAAAVVINKGETLEGRETEIRSKPTNFSKLIVRAMQAAAPQAQVVLLNGGSIRVDDQLMLPVTQYDILRSLPFGGAIVQADIKGSLLENVLNTGIDKNIGIGGYLIHNDELTRGANGNWQLNGQSISKEKIYRVAMPEFLLSGREANLDFLNEKNPGVEKVYPAPKEKREPLSDVRMAVIKYLQKNKATYLR